MAYTTLENVQAEVRADAPFSSETFPSDTDVLRWISEADAYIDFLAGRSFEEATHVELINYDAEERIQLKHAPVLSITTFKYSTVPLGDATYPAWETKTNGTHYSVYEDRGEIEILSRNWSPASGNKRIEVTYTSGYETIPAYVQMLSTKLVAARVIDTTIAKDLNEKQSGKSISVGSISIVKSASFGVQSYVKLKGDIEELKAKIVEGTGTYRYNNY